MYKYLVQVHMQILGQWINFYLIFSSNIYSDRQTNYKLSLGNTNDKSITMKMRFFEQFFFKLEHLLKRNGWTKNQKRFFMLPCRKDVRYYHKFWSMNKDYAHQKHIKNSWHWIHFYVIHVLKKYLNREADKLKIVWW